MNNLQNKMIVILVFLLCLGTLSSQSTELSLFECIEVAKKQSPAGKMIESRKKQRDSRNRAFWASLYPQLSFDVGVPGLRREINQILQPDGTQRFLQQSQLFSSAGLSLSQVIPELGSSISLFSGLNRLDILEPTKDQLWQATPLQIFVSQPLFAFNQLIWEKEIQELEELNIERRYIEEIEQLSVEVTSAFFNAYIAEMNLENAKRNVSINDTLYTLSKGRFSVGSIAENDLLQSELALMNAKNEVDVVTIEYERAIQELSILLDIPEGQKITLASPTTFIRLEIDFKSAIEIAFENRSELLQLEIEQKQAERNLDRAEKNNSLNATISASYGLNQSAGTFRDSYSALLERERLNITLSAPIIDWGQRGAEVEEALEALNEQKINSELIKNNFKNEVKYEAIRFMQLQDRIELAKQADNIAERRFEVAKNRFLIGKIDLNTFFIAQNEKNQAFQTYIRTLQEYWTAFYRIRRLTHYDFQNSKPIRY